MAISIRDYLIEQGGIDWSKALQGWEWLIPHKFTLWMVSRFADLFLVLDDGSVHMLDVGCGLLNRVADSREQFSELIDDMETAEEWLMIPLVDAMVEAGVRLQPGECYGFVTPPVLGGEYDPENVRALPIADYLGAYASIHEQLVDIPDGQEVILKVVDTDPDT